jgi:hypothetical protein
MRSAQAAARCHAGWSLPPSERLATAVIKPFRSLTRSLISARVAGAAGTGWISRADTPRSASLPSAASAARHHPGREQARVGTSVHLGADPDRIEGARPRLGSLGQAARTGKASGGGVKNGLVIGHRNLLTVVDAVYFVLPHGRSALADRPPSARLVPDPRPVLTECLTMAVIGNPPRLATVITFGRPWWHIGGTNHPEHHRLGPIQTYPRRCE